VSDVNALVERLMAELGSGDQVVLMSNGSFQGLPALLQSELERRHTRS
jgi:hypothetical protein